MAVTSYTSDGHVAEMQRSATSGSTTTIESWLYSYLPSGNANAGLLSGVTLRTQVNGGAWTTVQQVQYTYYDGTQTYGGNLGDLMTATVKDGSGNVLDTSYYRYYTSNSSTGYTHGLEYIFNPASYDRLTAALGTNLSNLTDAQVAPYADNYFQYDSLQRVTEEVAAGDGPGTADVATAYFAPYGNTQWIKDPDGFIQYDAYDPVTGAEPTQIVDVNTADTSEFSNLPSGWSTPSGGGLNLVTQYQVDALGRTTKETSPAGNITYYVYLDPQHEERIYRGWNSTTDTPTGPTEVYREDASGTYTEALTMTATPHLTNGAPDGTEAISGLQTLTRDYVNAAGQTTAEYAYYNLGGLAYSTGTMGSVNVNY